MWVQVVLLSFQTYFCLLSGSKSAWQGAWGAGFALGHCLVVHKVLAEDNSFSLCPVPTETLGAVSEFLSLPGHTFCCGIEVTLEL